jgi:hypothetical protein
MDEELEQRDSDKLILLHTRIMRGRQLLHDTEPYHQRDLAYLLGGRLLDSMRADLARFNSAPAGIMCMFTWENKQ